MAVPSASRRRRPALALVAIAAPAAFVLAPAAAPAATDPILQLHGPTLTAYGPQSPTPVQGLRPAFAHRGVGLDGTLMAPAAQGWAMAGNPFEGAMGRRRMGPVDLALGAVSLAETDLALPQPGPVRWTIGRSYNQAQRESNGSHRDSADAPQGVNWFQTSQPEIVVVLTDPPKLSEDDLVVIVYGAGYLEFRRVAEDEDEFVGRNGAGGLVQHVPGAPDTWVYYDQNGTRTTFFGGNTSGGRADWQIWKMEVAKVGSDVEHRAFVGHPDSAADAVAEGYNADGTIAMAVDAADRRYTYSYTAVGGAQRLAGVVAETKTGGDWAAGTATGVAEVGRVEYAYYGDDEDHGLEGDLKLVKRTIPTGAPGRPLVRFRAYRYYTQAFDDADGRRGRPHQVKLILGEEGARTFGLDHATTVGFDTIFDDAVTDAALKPYADAFFEYAPGSDRRVAAAFFDGDCGCSGGGANGVYRFGYGQASGYSTMIANSTYNEDWATWTQVERPDGGWERLYFDEAGQGLSHALTDGDPDGSFTQNWVTQVIRNEDGQVAEVRSPAANDAWDPSDGSMTLKTDEGLVTLFDRVSSSTSSARGFIEHRKHAKGAGTAYTDSTTTYSEATLTVGSATLVRPLVSGTAVYEWTGEDGQSALSHATSMTYTFWSGTLMPKQITTTLPAVDEEHNGSETPASTNVYLRKGGTAAFRRDAVGAYTYTAFNAEGLLAASVRDAALTEDFGADDPGGWGISETQSPAARVHDRTEYAYDPQGRNISTLRHAQAGPGQQLRMEQGYDRLPDQRAVVFRSPYTEPLDPSGTRLHGEFYYGVYNAIGGQEWCIILGNDQGTTTPFSEWFLVLPMTLYSNPLTAVDPGIAAVRRASSGFYSKTGSRLLEGRKYHKIPGSVDGLGTAGVHYDATLYAYDAMGRHVRTLDPTGTITAMEYDLRGRRDRTWIGADDSGGAGDDMTLVEALEFDGGSSGGNGHLTKRTAFVQDTSTGARETVYRHDYRGRLRVVVPPEGPATVLWPDNLGRQVAAGTYKASSASVLTASTDPRTTASGRLALSLNYHDARGQVWQTRRYKVNQSTGALEDSLETLSWFDPAGRLLKHDGDQLTKHAYDTLGRQVRTFILASDNDTEYDDAATVAGDVVLEEHQTCYDPGNGLVVMQVAIRRRHDDTTTTGALDGDGDMALVDFAEVAGEAAITAYWHDARQRPIATAFYGHNGYTNFDRALAGAAPTASDSARLVTRIVYDDAGAQLEAIDPKGRVTRYEYDDAGRLTATVANYVEDPSGTGPESTESVYTRYAYANGLQTHMWTDVARDDTDGVPPLGGARQSPQDDDDQVTRYVYGVSKGSSTGDSKIASGRLLAQVIYPYASGSESDHSVSYAYNAQGETIWRKDQTGVVTETDYDLAGRLTHQRFTTIPTGVHDAVKRISTTYDERGAVASVTQYSHATPGSGTALDGVAYTYDAWGLVSNIEQDRNSAVAPSGDQYFVGFTHGKGTGGRNALRRTSISYSGHGQATYSYLSSGGSFDGASSRVSRVQWTPGHAAFATTLAEYRYLGLDDLVGVDLPGPQVRANLFEGATSGDPYPARDRFGRRVSDQWTSYKGTGTRRFYEVTRTFDEAGNIVGWKDHVHTAPGGGDGRWDMQVDVDGLNRVTRAKFGHVTYDPLDGTPSVADPDATRDERWTLDQQANPLLYRLDLNGDLDYTDAGELKDRRTFGLTNQLLSRDLHDDTTVVQTPTHDLRGNLTADGAQYSYVYDALNRLVEVRKTSGSALLLEYRYNGLGHRIARREHPAGGGGAGPWRYSVFDDRWRVVAVYQGDEEHPREQYIYHAAGLDGRGGSSYIDAVICREWDKNSEGSAPGDEALEDRTFYAQNSRGDAVALLTGGGTLIETVRYSAYGVPFGAPAGDTDADGDYDAADKDRIADTLLAYDVRRDVNLDGVVDSGDITAAGSAGQTLGWGVLSKPGTASRRGYAGYESEPALAGQWTVYHARHRFYLADWQRWFTRDPLGYVDGMNMYAYVRGMALIAVDPSGLLMCLGCRTGDDVFPINPLPTIPGLPFVPDPAESLLQGGCVRGFPGCNAGVGAAACIECCNATKESMDACCWAAGRVVRNRCDSIADPLEFHLCRTRAGVLTDKCMIAASQWLSKCLSRCTDPIPRFRNPPPYNPMPSGPFVPRRYRLISPPPQFPRYCGLMGP